MRMKPAISLFCLAALLSGSAAADAPRAARVDFSSRPEGADVIIDGVTRGVTPITLFDVAPSATHHLRLQMDNREPADDFFSVEPGTYFSRHYELESVKGLLLVTSEPEGAMVVLDGYSLGTTPRLVTSLDVQKSYRLILQKAGYQSRAIDVRFNGRTPLVKHEKLILDSGTLLVRSSPEGAEVTVNGVSHGRTPVTVREVPKGRATVTVSHDGYVSQTREVVLNAGDERTLDVTLEGLPGSLLVTSVPGGARIYMNGGFCGKAPVTLNNLKPATYELRAELDGHETATRNVQIANGSNKVEEFRLANNQGRLEIKTSPVGAQVLVDGKLAGTTRSNNPAAAVSDAFAVENLSSGEHVVIVRKDGYSESVKHPVVTPGKSSTVKFTLKRVFIPNIEVVTTTGTYRGVLIGNTPDAVEIEVSMGVTRSFLRSNIREINVIGNK